MSDSSSATRRLVALKTRGGFFEHRLHLAGKPRKDIDVPEHESRRAAERVRDRLRTRRETRPPCRVVAETPALEAAPQVACQPLDLLAWDSEGCSDGLPSDVVRRPAETSRHEDVAGPWGLGAQEHRNLLDVVADGCEQGHLEADGRESPRKPGRVRVLDVARHDLVPHGQDDRCRRHVHTVSLPTELAERKRLAGKRSQRL